MEITKEIYEAERLKTPEYTPVGMKKSSTHISYYHRSTGNVAHNFSKIFRKYNRTTQNITYHAVA